MLPASSLTALMGPSGSSKTTLLDVLSGRTTAGTLARQGCVTYGGVREKRRREEFFFSFFSFQFFENERKKNSLFPSLLLTRTKKLLPPPTQPPVPPHPGLPPPRLRLRRAARGLVANLTVYEMLMYTAELGLSAKTTTLEERRRRVDEVLRGSAQAVRARADRVRAGQGRERGPGQVRISLLSFCFFGGEEAGAREDFLFLAPFVAL